MTSSAAGAHRPVYETSVSRVALMYRLRSPGTELRTLVLTVPGRPVAIQGAWDGQLEYGFVGHDVNQLCEYPDASFGRVVLHWVLDDFVGNPGLRRSLTAQRAVLREARRILVPGGIVTGCVANLVHRWPASSRLQFGRTPSRCVQLLTGAGFLTADISVALPSADSPFTLISTSTVAARHFFRLQLARSEEDLGRWSRLVRGLLVEAGISRHVQGSLFFSARAPC